VGGIGGPTRTGRRANTGSDPSPASGGEAELRERTELPPPAAGRNRHPELSTTRPNSVEPKLKID
jgi:hypothetical protein